MSKTAAAAASPHRTSLPPADPRRYAPTPERPLRGKARLMENQMDIQPHHHEWGQLVFSISGAVRVSTSAHTYIVPPSRAVWIPRRVVHAVSAIERAHLRTLYLHSRLTDGDATWSHSRVLEVSPLLRELVLQLPLDPEAPPATPAERERERCITHLVVDELGRARSLRLGVALPQDKRLRRLCEAMIAAPARHQALADWAAEVGASERTVSRLFREQLGTGYAQWRTQVLLAHALSMAAKQKPMSHIAAELGYASASAFSAMVTRTVGMPPSRFFAEA
ncbi:helix-turn-helix transcriptional regulator [Roseateles sp. DAIF2]|uniref:AraC family transcriptional regulator n=1 Tax=Roseateles sp. DAIF2 TaxID=2714952 RepID=UPI0018A295AD|nr:helix-turn-helix transcriptional regulator [Roseateles sp. DAIF2]QPF74768.1 helix-turn-helix transcriptional regulator [Roseateles sp. DAIF2]